MSHKGGNSRSLMMNLIPDLVYLMRLREFPGLVKNREKVQLHKLGLYFCEFKRKQKRILKQAEYENRNDIGLGHLRIPILDPEKAAKVEEIITEPELTILEGFEAGNLWNWLQQDRFEVAFEPTKQWLQEDFVLFEDEDTSSSSSDESLLSIILQVKKYNRFIVTSINLHTKFGRNRWLFQRDAFIYATQEAVVSEPTITGWSRCKIRG